MCFVVPLAQLPEHLTIDKIAHVGEQIHVFLTSAVTLDMLNPGAGNRMILFR